MDLFDSKNIKPMLIGETGDAFNHSDYIFELKLDGVRCLAYLDTAGTELRNKRNLHVSSLYPELREIHKQVKKRCILDGELAVINRGKPDFVEMQRRTLMSNNFRIDLAATKLPVSFTAFDILYLGDEQLTQLPLMERKQLLNDTVLESGKLAISRYIEEKGKELYALAEQQSLEGIVAKLKDSKYYFDKRTKEWIKIKHLLDDDFVICGFIYKDNGVVSLVLGKYGKDGLIYKGHVSLGLSNYAFEQVKICPPAKTKPFPAENDEVYWIQPLLVCTVKFMNRSSSGYMRQPVFKSLRLDKSPEECMETEN